MKRVAPDIITFAEFYSADGLVHSKTLADTVLPHEQDEKPVIFQIFGKDPDMFAKAAIMIERSGAAWVDINMGCPAKKVVKSGHGSSLMINRDTAFRIVEEMSKAVSIPVSVKTRLGWENPELLKDFCLWLQNAGANLITVHARTYKQAFTGKADWSALFDLKRHLSIPVIGNGDVLDYDDGVKRIQESTWLGSGDTMLDGFMIGRSTFGNPWSFLPWHVRPTLREILAIMWLHGDLLWERKWRKWMLEARKHLVQYLHGFPGVKIYRQALVTVETPEMIHAVLDMIAQEHQSILDTIPDDGSSSSQMEAWRSCDIACD